LLRSYEQCEFYQSNEVKAIPREIAAPAGMGKPIRAAIILISLLVIAGAALMGTPGGKNLRSGLFPSLSESPVDISNAASATVPASEVILHTTNTPTPAWIAIDTPTPRLVETVAAQPLLHGIEVTKMPPGSKQGYLVHVVAAGETLEVIAEDYNTTVLAILAVNYKLKPPVWAQYPIVIPVNTKDAVGLPAFKVYVVNDHEMIMAEALADVLGVEATALEYYNLCTGNCQFNKGDVLLVPYSE